MYVLTVECLVISCQCIEVFFVIAFSPLLFLFYHVYSFCLMKFLYKINIKSRLYRPSTLIPFLERNLPLSLSLSLSRSLSLFRSVRRKADRDRLPLSSPTVGGGLAVHQTAPFASTSRRFSGARWGH